MGLFSFLGGGSDLVRTAASNTVMEKYVGESPFTYSRKVYDHVLNSAEQFEARLKKDGSSPLSIPEISMLRLTMFAVLADNQNKALLRDNYLDAAVRLYRDHTDEIRVLILSECDRLARNMR